LIPSGQFVMLQRLSECSHDAQATLRFGLAKPGAETVRPYDLPFGDPVEDRPSATCEGHKLRATVRRVVDERDDALGGETVNGALHALAGEAHCAGDLGDGLWPEVDGAKNLPAGARLSNRAGEAISGGKQPTIEAKHFKDQVG